MPKRRSFAAAASCLGVTLLWCGCSTVDVQEGAAPGVRVQNAAAPQAGVRYNSVVILDKSLAYWDGKLYDPPWSSMFGSQPSEHTKHSKIAVESTDARRTATGTLEVWAVLRNRTDFPLQIEGRVQFFDANRVPSDGPTAWQRVYLPPQAVGTYRDFSTKVQEVNHYYVELREGR